MSKYLTLLGDKDKNLRLLMLSKMVEYGDLRKAVPSITTSIPHIPSRLIPQRRRL